MITFHKAVLTTPLEVHEIVEKLEQIIAPTSLYNRAYVNRKYSGKLSEDGFNIKRDWASELLISRKGVERKGMRGKSTIYKVVGVFEPEFRNTKIHLSIKWNNFAFFWFLLMACGPMLFVVTGMGLDWKNWESIKGFVYFSIAAYLFILIVNFIAAYFFKQKVVKEFKAVLSV
jgi:hypothetical protein